MMISLRQIFASTSGMFVLLANLAVASPRSPGLLLDTEIDGWGLWTAYGPGINERYGSANNSKHWHSPQRVTADGNSRILHAVDTGPDAAKRYQSGALSTREAPNGTGFFRFGPGIRSLRFSFEVTLSDWNHAVWPACWLRATPGGAGRHEIDVLEGFTAQTGVNLYKFAVHSGVSLAPGGVNFIRDPHPGTPLQAGERAVVWAEVHRPGTLHPTDAFIRAGKNSTVRVHTADGRTSLWWVENIGWDLIVQQQIGGNWVGDPDEPYTGTLQNGRPGLPAHQVPTWQGNSTMTIHRVIVQAELEEYSLYYDAGPLGSIAGASSQRIQHGMSGTPVEAVPLEHHRFVRWSDGVTQNPRTDVNVIADQTVTAEFAELRAAKGTPHWWLAWHNLNADGLTFDQAELLDFSGSGFRAWQEYLADTAPNDPASRWQVRAITHMDTGHLEIRFFSSPSRLYTLQTTMDFSAWSDVADKGPRLGTGGLDRMTAPVNNTHGFFRVKVELP